jgi:hypothetical protein
MSKQHVVIGLNDDNEYTFTAIFVFGELEIEREVTIVDEKIDPKEILRLINTLNYSITDYEKTEGVITIEENGRLYVVAHWRSARDAEQSPPNSVEFLFKDGPRIDGEEIEEVEIEKEAVPENID